MFDRMIEKHRAFGRGNGQEVVFRYRDALRFLDDLEGSGVVITGMSFYKDRDGQIVELIGNDTDHSRLVDEDEAATKSLREAKELLGDGLPDGADWVSFTGRSASN